MHEKQSGGPGLELRADLARESVLCVHAGYHKLHIIKVYKPRSTVKHITELNLTPRNLTLLHIKLSGISAEEGNYFTSLELGTLLV